MENPYGIDVANPRFFWSVDNEEIRGNDQTRYQIKIYNVSHTGKQQLIIDTGKISSNISSQIEVKGFTVMSHTDYIWNVTVFDSSNKNGTANGYFSGGLLNEKNDWMDAEWIGIPKFKHTGPAYQIRNSNITLNKQFNRIKCYIVMPGYYKAWINNQLIDDHVLGYFTTFEKRVYYDSFDCTKLFNQGQNVFGIWLGNGWYSQSSVNVGPPMFKLLIRVEYADDTIKYFKTNSKDYYQKLGPIQMNDIYLGEWYDATKETPGWLMTDYDYIGNGWTKSQIISNATVGKLVSSAIMPKAKKLEKFTAMTVSEPSPGIFVFDMGQNIAGVSRITIPGNSERGKNVTIIHSEELQMNGFVNANMYQNSPMIGTYTLRGDGNKEIYESSFTYYGFQYVQVEGYPSLSISQNAMESYFIHTDFDTSVGSIIFGPSNINNNDEFNGYLLNKIQHMTRYSSLSNFINLPTDCPQRERRGFLGDGQLTALVTIHNFDMAASYTKWIQDIQDVQQFYFPLFNGSLANTAPWYHHGKGPGDPSWTIAYTNMVYWMYKYFGDIRIIKQHYDSIKLQLIHLESQLDPKTGLLPVETNHNGDWCAVLPNSGGKGATYDCKHVSAILSTYDWGKQCIRFSELALVIGNKTDADLYMNKYNAAKQAIYDNFWDKTTGAFIDANHSATITTLNALALDLNVLSDKKEIASSAKSIADFIITNNYHINAGIFGVKFIYPQLCDNGYCDLAMNVSLQTSMPSHGFWFEQKATTLWEKWQATEYNATDDSSKNHIMFGAQGIWYYQYLAGIKQMNDSINWEKINIDPYTNTTNYGISIISASVNTYRGQLKSLWTTDVNEENTKQYLQINVTIPSGSIGDVYFRRNLVMIKNGNPSIDKWIVTEMGKIIWQNMKFSNDDDGVVNGKCIDDQYLVFSVQSGEYCFILTSS